MHTQSRRKILKKLKKNSAIKEAQDLDYNKDGSVQITVGLKESDDFYSPYAFWTYEFMNPEVKDYIETYESSIPIHESVSIDIYTETPTTQEDKKRIRRTVKRQYAESIIVTEREYKKNVWQSIIFFGIGIVLSIVEVLLFGMLENSYIDTILGIFSCMFAWDGLETLVYDCPIIKRQLIRQYRIFNAKVHVRQYSQKIKREYGLDEEDDEEDDD